MRSIALFILLGCAACSPQASIPATGPRPNPAATNGDVINRPDRAAPDTPAGIAPKRNFRDTAVDTDPSAPRTRDPAQRVQVPAITQ